MAYIIERNLPGVTGNGIYTAENVEVAGNLTVGGTTSIAAVSLTDLTVTGNTTIGNAAGDTLAVTGVSTFTAAAGTDAVNITGTAITTGKAIDIIDLAALTSGIGINVTSAATAITGAGRLIYSAHTGATSTSGILNEFASAANDETVIVKITASDLNALGTGLLVSTATTTGTGITVTANAVSTGQAVLIQSSVATTVLTTTGRLFKVDHSGNATGSGVIAEVASAAADETVVMRVTASAALATGVLLDLSGTAVTTGTILDLGGLDALTTGTAINVLSNSADTGTRTLVNIKNDHASAVNVSPLVITQDAPTTTNFFKAITIGTFTIWYGNENTPNGALSGTKGDILLNGSATGQAFWCTGTTNWTALA